MRYLFSCESQQNYNEWIWNQSLHFQGDANTISLLAKAWHWLGSMWTFFDVIVNTLRPWQNGRHFPDDIFNRIFLNKNVRIPINFSLKFVPKGPINNNPALVQIMAWRRSGDKPLSEPMMVSLLTHICVIRPQWVDVNKMHGWGWYLTGRRLIMLT